MLTLMIPKLESQSFIEGTAVASLMILFLNLTEKGIAFFIKRYNLIHANDALQGSYDNLYKEFLSAALLHLLSWETERKFVPHLKFEKA